VDQTATGAQVLEGHGHLHARRRVLEVGARLEDGRRVDTSHEVQPPVVGDEIVSVHRAAVPFIVPQSSVSQISRAGAAAERMP
jgi:hypothetical protein